MGRVLSIDEDGNIETVIYFEGLLEATFEPATTRGQNPARRRGARGVAESGSIEYTRCADLESVPIKAKVRQ